MGATKYTAICLVRLTESIVVLEGSGSVVGCSVATVDAVNGTVVAVSREGCLSYGVAEITGVMGQAHGLFGLVQLAGGITFSIITIYGNAWSSIEVSTTCTITTPRHRNTFVQICLWNDEIFLWNPHLILCLNWILHTYIHLSQKMIEWSNKILTKIKIIMIHMRWQYD